jgi:hypothetical protein
MSKKVTLGGDRLGAGGKMQEELHGYGSSKHDLGYVWKSSMTVGTLVPFMVELMTNGDHATIDINSIIRTHPTIGAMFGSFKLQIDVFKCPIRYYNSMLHNNIKGIGLKMNEIYMPLMQITGRSINPNGMLDNDRYPNSQQINPSSLLHYLGISGLGRSGHYDQTIPTNIIKRNFNGIPLLAYWDIYANYYANLQEEIGAVIGTTEATAIGTIIQVMSGQPSGGLLPDPVDITQQALNPTTSGFWYKEWHMEVATYNDMIYITGENIELDNVKIRYEVSLNGGGLWVMKERKASNTEDLEATIFTVNETTNRIRLLFKTGRRMRLVSTMAQASIDVSGEINPDKDIEIKTFDIKNIDKMRKNILQASETTPYMIDKNADEPYVYTTGIITDTGGTFIDSSSKATMAGIGLKTYQSDRFNNWLNTEFIDGTNGVNELSAIDVSSGILTMDTLNLQQKIYNVLNRIALSGGSYKDWQEAVYAHRGTGELEIPEWLGGASSEIMFDEVISTSATEAETSEPLGTLGGRGRQGNIKKNEIHITANEPLFIIGIVSITPRLDYSQGNKWWSRLKNMNELHKPELDGIGFQELLTEEFAAFDTRVNMENTSISPVYNSVGKQLAWTEYTTNVNECHGNFVDGGNEQFMVLNRGYKNDEDGNLIDATTYIDPTRYNYAFATTDLTSQHFWIQLGIQINMSRIMASQQIPQL